MLQLARETGPGLPSLQPELARKGYPAATSHESGALPSSCCSSSVPVVPGDGAPSKPVLGLSPPLCPPTSRSQGPLRWPRPPRSSRPFRSAASLGSGLQAPGKHH